MKAAYTSTRIGRLLSLLTHDCPSPAPLETTMGQGSVLLGDRKQNISRVVVLSRRALVSRKCSCAQWRFRVVSRTLCLGKRIPIFFFVFLSAQKILFVLLCPAADWSGRLRGLRLFHSPIGKGGVCIAVEPLLLGV